MYLTVLFSRFSNTGNTSASDIACAAHINIQSKVAVTILIINKGGSGRKPHVEKYTGWGGERQHPNLASLSMASSVQSRVSVQPLPCLQVVWNLGILAWVFISQLQPYTPLPISSQHLVCPLQREHRVIQRKTRYHLSSMWCLAGHQAPHIPDLIWTPPQTTCWHFHPFPQMMKLRFRED